MFPRALLWSAILRTFIQHVDESLTGGTQSQSAAAWRTNPLCAISARHLSDNGSIIEASWIDRSAHWSRAERERGHPGAEPLSMRSFQVLTALKRRQFRNRRLAEKTSPGAKQMSSSSASSDNARESKPLGNSTKAQSTSKPADSRIARDACLDGTSQTQKVLLQEAAQPAHVCVVGVAGQEVRERDLRKDRAAQAERELAIHDRLRKGRRRLVVAPASLTYQCLLPRPCRRRVKWRIRVR